MSVRINTLQIENTKRVKAFAANMEGAALTVIGGKNGAGKTSVLDAIAYTLGGEKYRPSNIQRDGADDYPAMRVELSNGLVVERGGKNSTLKITDPNGMHGGQKLLDSFVSTFALDLPKFRNATTKEKAAVLLQVIGVGDKLAILEAEEKRIYADRTDASRESDRATKAADAMPEYADAPEAPLSVVDLGRKINEAQAENDANRQARYEFQALEERGHAAAARVTALAKQLEAAQSELDALRREHAARRVKVLGLSDIDISHIVAKMNTAEDLNAKFRANQAKAEAKAMATGLVRAHAALDAKLSAVRRDKAALLEGADLPLPGLAVNDGELYYNGQPWDCMSGAEQLRVSTAIVRRLNPECGFVLLDKLEEMDLDTLAEFGAWLESEGLQAIATRVSTGEECSIIIEDGTAVANA